MSGSAPCARALERDQLHAVGGGLFQAPGLPVPGCRPHDRPPGPGPPGGDGLISFTAAAESQGYRPRYALTTGSTPAGMSDATSDQAKGAMAVSWQVDDLLNLNAPPSSFPAVPANSGRTQCNQTYGSFAAAHGTPVASFYPWCDALALLQTVGKAKVVTVASLLSGVES